MALIMPIWLVCWVISAISVLSTSTTLMKQRDHRQHLHHHGDALDEEAPPVFVRVLVQRGAHADALLAQAILDPRCHFLGEVLAVGRHAHVEVAELALLDAEALHARGVHEEEGLAAELWRGHEGVADLADDGQGFLLSC